MKPLIESDKQVLNGEPCIRGTRIPVMLLLELMIKGYTYDEIIKQHPSLKPMLRRMVKKWGGAIWNK